VRGLNVVYFLAVLINADVAFSHGFFMGVVYDTGNVDRITMGKSLLFGFVSAAVTSKGYRSDKSKNRCCSDKQ
jgi:hypothetical protein